MLLRGVDCSMVQTWMKKKRDTYLSHDIQDELIASFASQILGDVSRKIHNGGFFTLMCDECNDVPIKSN